MKIAKNIALLILLTFLFGCNSNKLNLAISTINTIEPIFNKEDSILYASKIAETEKLTDSCERYKMNCLIHFPESYPDYKGGINKFREAVYKNIKIPKNSKPSKYTVNFVIGRNDSIESMEITGFEDNNMKKEIEKAMKNDSIWKRKWKSGSFFRHKIKYKYEYEIEIYKNNRR